MRSNHQPYCFVQTTSGNTNQRLQALTKAKNGFELAEMDLKIRGAGELYGKSQSGITDLGMEAMKNIKMVEAARKEAKKIVEKDTTLEKCEELKKAVNLRKEKLHFE
jgi:ATP-dependent DNA helicase RecG